jgi:hypothetical protein
MFIVDSRCPVKRKMTGVRKMMQMHHFLVAVFEFEWRRERLWDASRAAR